MNPAARIHNELLKLDILRKNMIAAIERRVDTAKVRLQRDMAQLDMLSPLAVLERGYGIVRKVPDGQVIRDVLTIAVGDQVHVTVSSGAFDAEITHVSQEKTNGRNKI
jgi:exodeoxyribonuclease VII large subunit